MKLLGWSKRFCNLAVAPTRHGDGFQFGHRFKHKRHVTTLRTTDGPQDIARLSTKISSGGIRRVVHLVQQFGRGVQLTFGQIVGVGIVAVPQRTRPTGTAGTATFGPVPNSDQTHRAPQVTHAGMSTVGTSLFFASVGGGRGKRHHCFRGRRAVLKRHVKRSVWF